MIRVEWPTRRETAMANIWRVLDLSGLTTSVRESRNFLKAGYVYVDDVLVISPKDTIEFGRKFTLSLKFPNGKVNSKEIMLVPSYMSNRNERNTKPFEVKYRS